MLTPHCDTLFAVQLKLLEHPVDRFQPWTYFRGDGPGNENQWVEIFTA